MTTKKIFKGFEFAKVGTFFLSDTPFKHTNGKSWDRPTSIDLINEEILNAECSTYLVVIGSEYTEKSILYVGEYTNSLKQRWFRKHKDAGTWVSWHSDNLDDNLNILLKTLSGIDTFGKTWKTTASNKKEFEEKLFKIIKQAKAKEDVPKISIWLTTDPYLQNPIDGSKINVSQSIEREFLRDESLALPLNSKGRSGKGKGTKSVTEILNLK